MPWIAHIDGGSRGNPGPAAAGVAIHDEGGTLVLAAGFYVGRATNNFAEYSGLLRALDLLAAAKARRVEIVSDSELLVRQINGQYKVKSADLKPLFDDAKYLLSEFEAWKVRHVLREKNKEADGLANKAMDVARDVVVCDALGLLGKKAGGSGAPAAPPSAPAASSGGGAAKPAASSSPASRGTRSDATGSLFGDAPVTSAAKPRGAVDCVVLKAPDRSQCSAGLKQGQLFRFTDVTPPGLCVHACSAVIEAVIALRGAGRDTMPMTVSCQNEGCSARFEVRP